MNKKVNRDESKDSRKTVNRSDSRGKGDSDIRKYLMRKDSKGVDKIKEDKKSSDSKATSDLKKLLTRKESKTREKEEKEFKKEKEKQLEDSVPVKKHHSLVEGKNLVDDDVDGPHSPENDGKVELDFMADPAFESSKECIAAQENSQKIEIHETRPNVLEAKRQSRFTLKAQFNKLDARFRKAFSSENNASMESNSEFYIDDEIVVIDTDGEMKDGIVSEMIEDKSSSADFGEVGKEMKDNECSTVLSNETEVLVVQSSSGLSPSPKISPRTSPKSSPKPTPKTTPGPSPLEEVKDLEPAMTEESKGKETNNTRSGLTLFDEDGNPIPPPRRKVRLGEGKQRMGKVIVDSIDIDKESGSSSYQSLGENHGAESLAPPGTPPGDKEESALNSRKLSSRSQGLEITPTQTPNQVASTGLTVTSPNSKGAFKSFVSHITKKSTSQTAQGMFSWSPFVLANKYC